MILGARYGDDGLQSSAVAGWISSGSGVDVFAFLKLTCETTMIDFVSSEGDNFDVSAVPFCQFRSHASGFPCRWAGRGLHPAFHVHRITVVFRMTGRTKLIHRLYHLSGIAQELYDVALLLGVKRPKGVGFPPQQSRMSCWIMKISWLSQTFSTSQIF